MSRPSASIIVTAQSWPEAQPCVDRLRPRLGVRDEMLVAIADEFGVPLAQQGSVRVVMGAPDTVRKDAASVAHHDIVVFVDAHLLPAGHWLDALVAPFTAPDVAAVGPRLVGADGAQGVEVPAGLAGDQRRDFARSWSQEHRGELTDTDTLAPECVALRKSGSATRMVIAHDAFIDVPVVAQVEVPRVTTRERTGPLVSACMIVRDEEETLGRCLAALGGLVDEMVVYDTGSVDKTIEIARGAGATVIQGAWTDDFAAVRNAALDHCSGEWIVHVDADDILNGDRAAFRAVLEGDPPVDTISITIDNLDATGGAVDHSHPATRVFRRTAAHWKGRLHEQVVARPGQPELRIGYTSHIRLLHSGYHDEFVAEKSERNIRIAEAELADGTDRRALITIHLGRSLASAGRLDEALARFEEALEATDDDTERRLALRHGAEALLDSGRPLDALGWIERLRAASERSDMADYLEGIARGRAGETEAGLDLLMGLLVVRDEDGFVIPDHVLRLRRSFLLRDAKRWADVADELLAIVSDDMAPPWAMLVEASWRAERSADEVAAAIPASHLTAALGQLLTLDPEIADGVADALYARWGEDVAVLAAACAIAPRLPVLRALEWSARLRAAGVGDQCPLLVLAQDDTRCSHDRLQALCLMFGAFGDERAQSVVAGVAASVPENELVPSLVAMGELAPALLPGFILAAASDTPRGLILADGLNELGATDQAEAVKRHALELAK